MKCQKHSLKFSKMTNSNDDNLINMIYHDVFFLYSLLIIKYSSEMY